MPNKTLNIGEQYRSLAVNPASLNVEGRTVDAVFATETPVLSRNWELSSRNDGLFYEILSCKPEHVRMERLLNGAPLLNNHFRENIEYQLGVVDDAKVENSKLSGKIRFSKREDAEKVFQDVADGIIRNISAGFRVYKYEAMAYMGEDQIPSFRAIDWEPTEISLTPVQADVNSKVRNGNIASNQVEIINLNLNKMPENQTIPAVEPEGTRAANTAPASAPVAAPVVNVEAERTAAIELERTRTMEIVSSVRSMNLDPSFGEKLIKDGVSIDQARKLMIDEFATKDPNKGSSNNFKMGVDETDKVRSAVSDAIILRANSSYERNLKPEAINVAREFRMRSLLDITRMMLERSGEKTSMLSDREMITRAMANSDLPNILASTVNRSLMTAYEEAPRTFMPWTRKVSIKDFKSVSRAQLSSLPTLSLVREGGEYPYGKMSDAKETYALAKYGEIIAINWESIVNDDLDAFSRLPIMLANAAANKQSDIVYAILSDNANLSDSVALFEASTHANYAGTGTTVTNGIAAARAAMRNQKGLGAAGTKASGFYLNIEPKYLLVGSAKEVEALQVCNGVIVPAVSTNVNVFAGTMTPIVEPRISGNAWYLSAQPGVVDTIEYAFLDGEPEIFTERKQGFEIDALEMKVRMVFAAKAIDHRGLYKNVGA